MTTYVWNPLEAHFDIVEAIPAYNVPKGCAGVRTVKDLDVDRVEWIYTCPHWEAPEAVAAHEPLIFASDGGVTNSPVTSGGSSAGSSGGGSGGASSVGSGGQTLTKGETAGEYWLASSIGPEHHVSAVPLPGGLGLALLAVLSLLAARNFQRKE